VGAGLLLAALGLGMAAQAAHATTFPGTNGRIAGSGPLNTDPLNTGSKLELFTMRSAFSSPAAPPADVCQVTDNTNSDFNPRFSKDGKKIAFVRDNNVRTMKLDASGRCALDANNDGVADVDNELTSGNTDSFVGGWSPPDAGGNAWIVFQSSRDGNFEVYKVQVDADGAKIAGTETRLTNNPANDSQPAFRPDGQKIAFHSNRGDVANSNIWVMDADGSNPQMLAQNSPIHEESAPAFSPDGTQIAFQSDRGDVPRPALSPRNLEIYRMNTNGSGGVTRLTYSDTSQNTQVGVINVTGYDLTPSWSPDGTRMCFHSGRAQEDRDSNGVLIHGQWELYTLDAVNGEHDAVLNPTGTSIERLTNRAGNDERCGWQEAAP
jgi:Tol biopolymer transport system component